MRKGARGLAGARYAVTEFSVDQRVISDEIDRLWAWVDSVNAGEPRLPLVTLGEARAAVMLLRELGEEDGEAAALAGTWRRP